MDYSGVHRSKKSPARAAYLPECETRNCQKCQTAADWAHHLSMLPVGVSGDANENLERGVEPIQMSDRTHREQMGTRGWNTDALVWSVIQYLDSSTDYREYLPRPDKGRFSLTTERRQGDRRKDIVPSPAKKAEPQEKKSEVQKGDFVVLDNVPDCWWSRLRLLTLIAVFICMLLLAWMRS